MACFEPTTLDTMRTRQIRTRQTTNLSNRTHQITNSLNEQTRQTNELVKLQLVEL